ncbi:MAG TPA: DNA methyltransferase, partial [Acidimicrobiales bacterium]|nr:DNA methyltransferase [Acidimicrobiales bacterium]
RGAANPVLRDITERVVVASKGRFDRARSVKQRQAEGLPAESSLMTEEFMALTLDVWEIPPESARRVGHPAPFPVELPEQLIRLYTFEGDLVLDPFMGSGSALVAAARLGRRYVGYDTDAAYVDIARRRVADALAVEDADEDAALRQAARDEGKAATKLAEDVLVDAGFTITERNRRVRRSGVAVSFVAADAEGAPWLFDVAGPFTSHRDGLVRTEAVWRSLGRAAALRGRSPGTPVVLLTTSLPRRPSEGDTALRAAGPGAVFDVVDLLSHAARTRLRDYAKGGRTDVPDPGFWTAADRSS